MSSPVVMAITCFRLLAIGAVAALRPEWRAFTGDAHDDRNREIEGFSHWLPVGTWYELFTAQVAMLDEPLCRSDPYF